MDIKAIKQDLFSKSYGGLRKQGFVQAQEGSNCVYLTADGGSKCAIGQLIEDAKEARYFDGFGSVSNIFTASSQDPDGGSELVSRFGRAIGAGDSLTTISQLRGFLVGLQSCHDDWSGEKMDRELQIFAQLQGLEVPA